MDYLIKIDIVPEQETIPYVSENVTNESKTTASIELMLNGCTLKIHNNVNPTLLAQTINIIRGSIC